MECLLDDWNCARLDPLCFLPVRSLEYNGIYRQINSLHTITLGIQDTMGVCRRDITHRLWRGIREASWKKWYCNVVTKSQVIYLKRRRAFQEDGTAWPKLGGQRDHALPRKLQIHLVSQLYPREHICVRWELKELCHQKTHSAEQLLYQRSQPRPANTGTCSQQQGQRWPPSSPPTRQLWWQQQQRVLRFTTHQQHFVRLDHQDQGQNGGQFLYSSSLKVVSVFPVRLQAETGRRDKD